MTELFFSVIAIDPLPQPRPRFRRIGNKVITYTPKAAKDYQDELVSRYRELLKECYEGKTITQPVNVYLVFGISRPASHYTRKQLLKPSAPNDHTQRPDLDNLAKPVMDALVKAKVLHDDALITVMEIKKTWVHADTGHIMLSIVDRV